MHEEKLELKLFITGSHQKLQFNVKELHRSVFHIRLKRFQPDKRILTDALV